MPDATSDRLVSEHDRTFIFEPLPDAVDVLRKYYAPQTTVVVKAACAEKIGYADFQVYNRNGLSSSIGTMTAQATVRYRNYDLSLVEKLRVRTVNLCEFLQDYDQASECVTNELETLMIDAQGMDLTVLKTMKPFLERYAIKTIQCEADGLGFTHYDGLPSNSEADFMDFMSQFPQYEFSKVEGRNDFNPDLRWVRTT
jgi:FkbM family methyltransferase